MERNCGRGYGSRMGISKEEIAAALKTFKSVKRRLEVRAEVSGITIIEDFAHHPTAIAGTLTALRSRYPGARLWAILEPRSNTLRRNVLQNDLAESLALADESDRGQCLQVGSHPGSRTIGPGGRGGTNSEAREAGTNRSRGRRDRATGCTRDALRRCRRHPFQRRLWRNLRETAGNA